jgi:hypothetical protein
MWGFKIAFGALRPKPLEEPLKIVSECPSRRISIGRLPREAFHHDHLELD